MLLKTRLETALVSGQSTEAAGLLSSRANISPPTRSRPFTNTGVDTALSPGVRSCSRHQVLPVRGSSDVTAS